MVSLEGLEAVEVTEEAEVESEAELLLAGSSGLRTLEEESGLVKSKLGFEAEVKSASEDLRLHEVE